MLSAGQLRDYDGGEYDRAARYLRGCHLLTEHERARDRGYDRLERHYHGRERGIGADLSDHLEGVGRARREHAAEQQRGQRLAQRGDIRRVECEHERQTDDRYDRALRARQFQTVAPRREVIAQHDVHRNHKRAHRHDYIAP